MATEEHHEIETQAETSRRDFRTYARILLKYAPLIIGITVITTAIAVVYSLTATEIYEARALIRIKRENSRLTMPFDMLYGNSRELDYFQTQIKLFYSRTLIRNVLNQLSEEGKPYNLEGVNSEEGLINAFLKKITVRPEPRTQLVHVVLEDENKSNARLFVNTLARMYIRQSVENEMEDARHYGNWFRDRATAQEEKIQEREKEVLDFKKRYDLDPAEVGMAQETLQRLQQQLNMLSEQKFSTNVLSEADAFLLEQRIVDLEDEINEKKQQINKLQSIEAEYRMLSERLDTAREQYRVLLKYAEEGGLITTDFDPRNISIVDEAPLPQRPARPRKTVNVLFGMLFGVVLGVSVAFFAEYLDDTIKSPTDVEHFLHVPFLGLIPGLGRGQQSETPIEGIVEHQPKGSIAENYRAIRTNILFSSDRPIKRLVVTSAGPGEGKTTSIVNLAHVMARAGDMTLLIDADMRRPRIHKLFGLDADAKGISNYLVGTATLEEIVHPTHIEKLHVIPAGPIPPNPVELLNSPRVLEVLDAVSERYERVMMDSPPVIAVTDAAILARMADGVILAIHGGHAHRDIVKRAIETLRNVGGQILGVILNNVNIYRASYYDYYYYSYYRYAYGYSYRRKADARAKRGSRRAKDEARVEAEADI
jgi:capsular exopolysaccharide synthesis family protein